MTRSIVLVWLLVIPVSPALVKFENHWFEGTNIKVWINWCLFFIFIKPISQK